MTGYKACRKVGSMEDSNVEKIGSIADRVSNLVAGLTMPIEDALHVKMLKDILPEIESDLKDIVVSETGDNPWE